LAIAVYSPGAPNLNLGGFPGITHG
jgi:hypothetical protein